MVIGVVGFGGRVMVGGKAPPLFFLFFGGGGVLVEGF